LGISIVRLAEISTGHVSEWRYFVVFVDEANDFIFGNNKYYNRLLESKRQIENGKTVLKTTEELENMADEA